MLLHLDVKGLSVMTRPTTTLELKYNFNVKIYVLGTLVFFFRNLLYVF